MRTRLQNVLTVVDRLEVDLMLLVGSVAWGAARDLAHPRIRTLEPTVEIAERLRRNQPAALGIIAPPVVLASKVLSDITAGVPSEEAPSSRLTGVVERGIQRDELLVDVVRETVAPLAGRPDLALLPLDSHACLVKDVLQRVSGGREVLDVPSWIASALRKHCVRPAVEGSDGVHLTVLAPSADLDRIRRAVAEYLATPLPSAVPLRLDQPTRHRSSDDTVLLLYAALNAGQADEASQLLATGAKTADGRDLRAVLYEWASEVTRHDVDEILEAGRNVGIVGTRITDHDTNTFVHRWEFDGHRIVGLEVMNIGI